MFCSRESDAFCRTWPQTALNALNAVVLLATLDHYDLQYLMVEDPEAQNHRGAGRAASCGSVGRWSTEVAWRSVLGARDRARDRARFRWVSMGRIWSDRPRWITTSRIRRMKRIRSQTRDLFWSFSTLKCRAERVRPLFRERWIYSRGLGSCWDPSH